MLLLFDMSDQYSESLQSSGVFVSRHPKTKFELKIDVLESRTHIASVNLVRDYKFLIIKQ